MNYLLPIKPNWLLPPTKETQMKMATTPLASKLAALESGILALRNLAGKENCTSVSERARQRPKPMG